MDAVISDIHGNLEALDAVFQEIRADSHINNLHAERLAYGR